jgi:hypothetical protein
MMSSLQICFNNPYHGKIMKLGPASALLAQNVYGFATWMKPKYVMGDARTSMLPLLDYHRGH